eukprot:1316238-Rhodomonas_salina.1
MTQGQGRAGVFDCVRFLCSAKNRTGDRGAARSARPSGRGAAQCDVWRACVASTSSDPVVVLLAAAFVVVR